MPDFTFYGGRKQAKTNFSFSFKTWVWSLRTQLQGNSPPFDMHFQGTGISVIQFEKREFILKATFSLPSPVVDAKAP